MIIDKQDLCSNGGLFSFGGSRRGARGPLYQIRANNSSLLSIFYSKENDYSADLALNCRAFTNATAGGNVDWHGFALWLKRKGLSKKHRASMLNYSRKWCHVLFSGRLSEIEGVAGQKHILMALANLSKFLGCYSLFRKAKEESGLTWKTRNGIDIFQRIYENELDGIEDWVDRVVETGDKVLFFPVLFMALSGLRVVECLKSLNRISCYGLDDYCKSGVLEHFRFPDEFLRKNKNAYVTIVPDQLLSELKDWDRHISYAMLVKRCKKYRLQRRFHGLRKFYATKLRMEGLPTEIVNLLQGRVGGSIFVASYLRPNFEDDVVKRVRQVISVHAQKWIQ